ncbi:proline iminopeptidase [Auriscalpium vulgare]|uniref:Proline iminopeptidase n=1 Tax=Auriscalpium vulgare TaxID=40419 RepID=A0ACB8RVC3_9AGAM|nr:proline iminopeptidase [Auriscalpium vulgare]
MRACRGGRRAPSCAAWKKELAAKVFGNFTDRSRTPLVVPHGGPGISHDYLLPASDLAQSHSIPVIFYDQLGAARSTHLPGKPTSFWTIDLFIDELVNLINHFGIQESFDLLGHSWGGVLGVEYEVRRQPKGLRRLILTNSLPSMALWGQSSYADIPRYKAALAKFHAKHGCRIDPIPEDLQRTLNFALGEDGDPTVGREMFQGELKEWSVVDQLHLVRVPTLVANGRYDIAQDFVCEPFESGIRQAKRVRFEDSSHSPQWEEREKFIEVIAGFLEE